MILLSHDTVLETKTNYDRRGIIDCGPFTVTWWLRPERRSHRRNVMLFEKEFCFINSFGIYKNSSDTHAQFSARTRAHDIALNSGDRTFCYVLVETILIERYPHADRNEPYCADDG